MSGLLEGNKEGFKMMVEVAERNQRLAHESDAIQHEQSRSHDRSGGGDEEYMPRGMAGKQQGRNRRPMSASVPHGKQGYGLHSGGYFKEKVTPQAPLQRRPASASMQYQLLQMPQASVVLISIFIRYVIEPISLKYFDGFQGSNKEILILMHPSSFSS